MAAPCPGTLAPTIERWCRPDVQPISVWPQRAGLQLVVWRDRLLTCDAGTVGVMSHRAGSTGKYGARAEH